jgi:hypothetical protein
MTQEEKLLKLLQVAVENGFKDEKDFNYLLRFEDFLQEFLEEFCKLHNNWLDNKTQQFIKKYKLHNDGE